MSIANEAMVVNIQIGMWTGHRLDKEESRKVTETNGAESDAARVNKHIIPKDALKPIVNAGGALRQHFYQNTLPWKDNGDRLLVRKLYFKYIQDYGKLKGDFDTAVDHFLEHVYPSIVAQAEFRMGALFKAEDYPKADTLRNKFYISQDIDAVTEAGDFRVTMDKNTLVEVQNSIETAMGERLNKAMKEVWTRLSTAVENFQERMESDGKFKSATIENLRELVDMMPALNITNDPDLDRIAQEIKGTLNGVDAKDLRKDDLLRKQMSKDAQEIMENMSGFMKAFG